MTFTESQIRSAIFKATRVICDKKGRVIDKVDVKNFIELIKPYVPDCMCYKVREI